MKKFIMVISALALLSCGHSQDTSSIQSDEQKLGGTTTLFGILDVTTIEPVGARFLSVTIKPGFTKTFLLTFERIIDQDLLSDLENKAARVEIYKTPRPAPQSGSLYVVKSITLYPILETFVGDLHVFVTQAGYKGTLVIGDAEFALKTGRKTEKYLEKLGMGTHENVTVAGALWESQIAAEEIIKN